MESDGGSRVLDGVQRVFLHRPGRGARWIVDLLNTPIWLELTMMMSLTSTK